MSKTSRLLIVVFCSLISPLLHADVAAIHVDKLPQEKAVLAALDDAREMEPYSHVWSPEWKFPLSKKEVAKRLGKDMGVLVNALKAHPENEELALLTGLVARYGYNVDLKDSPDVVLSALSQAATIDQTDFRTSWFHATFMCETLQPAAGETEFLSLEESRPWDQLPAAFWIDYMECASHTNMSAHVLRAADHLAKLHGVATPLSNTYLNKARSRFEPYDPKKQHDPNVVWQREVGTDGALLTSTSCGLRLKVRTIWRIDRLDLTEGSCVVVIRTGPYEVASGGLSPEIMILIQQPKEGETLDEFSKQFLTKGTFAPYMPTRCPGVRCLALKGEQSGMYVGDGGGRPRTILFERDEPAFPALIFETPSADPKPDKPGPFTFPRPSQTQRRIPGKLYYLVLLDTAADIEEPALKDFDFFLENLTVE